MSKPEKILGYPKNVFILGLVSLFTDLSNEIILRTIPLFLANVLGVKTAVIGLVEGVAESTSTVLKIFSGWLSDLAGRRKPLTVLGYSLSALSKPFLYFAGSWPAVFLVRFFDRVGKGIRTSPRDALIADSTPPAEMGRAFGLHRTLDPLGAVLGTALAGLLVLWSTKGTVVLDRTIFKYLVLISLVPAAISVILLAAGVKEPEKEPEKPEENKEANEMTGEKREKQEKRFKRPGFAKGFTVFLVINVIFALGNSSDAFLILRAQKLGTTLAGIFFLLAVFNTVSAFLSLPAGSLSDRLGRKKLLVSGWALYALVYLGFAYARTSWQIWFLYSVYGAYYGITDGAARALVADVVEPGQRGAAYGLYHAAVGLTALPASLVAGILWDRFGSPAPFIFGSIMALVATLGLLFWIEDKRQPAPYGTVE